MRYAEHMLDEFKTEISEFIHSMAPEATIFYNGSHVGPRSKNSFKEYSHLELESLPKTQEELASEAGTEAADYPNKVTSTALGMEDAEKRVQEAGVQASWDEDTRQNYAQWDADGGTYKIWLEDSQSLEEKLKLIKKNDLAGVAEWRLGWENSGVWDLISQYIN